MTATRFIAATICWCCLLAGCKEGATAPAPGGVPTTASAGLAAPSVQREIADLTALPQDCTAYLDPATKDLPLLSPQQHKARCEEFRQKFFAPWLADKARHGTGVPPVSSPSGYGREQAEETHGQDAHATDARQLRQTLRLQAYEANPGFGHNGRQLCQSFYQKLVQLACLDSFPNRSLPAIAIRNANIRQLPTALPRFDDFHSEADGYPFDTLQESAIWAGTPLLICHAASDGSWFYVQAPFVEGWVSAADVATVDDAFIKDWRERELVAMVQDDVPITDQAGIARFNAHIGAVFPLASTDGHGFSVLIPAADACGQAVRMTARIPAGKAAMFGLAPTPSAIAAVANRMIGQPYGWGGMYEARDCSATVRDIFVPFGIWLPRNSANQAQAGNVINLKGLASPQKEQRIIQQGVPLATLIACPGHIMLYAGVHAGRPIILHNFWGIHVVRPSTCSGPGNGRPEGRNIVGRCSITTLEPGIELPDIVKPNGDLLNRIDAMTLLLP
jgi:hypothetical protein